VFLQGDVRMRMNKRMKRHVGSYAGRLFVGLLAGATTGAAVALLYAPSSGRVVRDSLTDWAREGRYRAAVVADVLSMAVADGREAYRQTKAGDAVLSSGYVS
jgi:gas vesicle protein